MEESFAGVKTLARASSDLPATSARQLGAVLAALQQAGRLAAAHGMDRSRVTTCRAAVAGVATALAASHRDMAAYADDDAAAGTVRGRVLEARRGLEADRAAAEAELEELEAAAVAARDAAEERAAVLRARQQEAEDARSGDVESLAEAARRRRDEALEEAEAVREALERAAEALQDARSLVPAAGRLAAAGGAQAGGGAKRARTSPAALAGMVAERDALRAEAAALASVVARARSDGAEAEARAREERSVRAEAEADAKAAATAEAETERLRAAAAWYTGCTAAVVEAAAAGGSDRAVVLRALLSQGGECGMKELAAGLVDCGLESKDVTRLVYKLASARLVKLNRQPKGVLVQAMIM